MSRAKHWVFTINNWSAEDDERLRRLANVVPYIVFGYETGESGTPHLQGYVCFSQRLRLQQAKRFVGETAHLEVKRGTPKQASEYCKKDGLYFEFGSLPEEERGCQFTRIREWAVAWKADIGRLPMEREVAEHWPGQYVRYRNNLLQLIQLCDDPPAYDTSELRDWQAEMETWLNGESDDRTVVFVVNPTGGIGKTWFQRYYLTKHPDKTQILSIGKRDDIAHAIDEKKSVFFFNVPRESMEYLNYSILEQIKDKMVFSPKYCSRTKLFKNNVHVVVFSNEMPDMHKMTEDRYHVISL